MTPLCLWEAEAQAQYQGEPRFEPIEGTSLSYAVNTADDVIRADGLYYLCLQGVWFASTSPTGPWQAARSVPGEIYEIPPSSPMHHTSYVSVYESEPEYVEVGYLPGYLGVYTAWGVAVYGTGYRYPPYVYRGPRPIVYPYPHTYGVAARYNPVTGTYLRGARVYGPYGGAGRGAAYNPSTGTYPRGASAWGPYGGAGAVRAYNPRTGARAVAGGAGGPGGAVAGGRAHDPRTDTSRAGYRSAGPYGSWGGGGGAAGRRLGPRRPRLDPTRLGGRGQDLGGRGRGRRAPPPRGRDDPHQQGRDLRRP